MSVDCWSRVPGVPFPTGSHRSSHPLGTLSLVPMVDRPLTLLWSLSSPVDTVRTPTCLVDLVFRLPPFPGLRTSPGLTSRRPLSYHALVFTDVDSVLGPSRFGLPVRFLDLERRRPSTYGTLRCVPTPHYFMFPVLLRSPSGPPFS